MKTNLKQNVMKNDNKENKALSQTSVSRSVDDEEAHWFIRWIKMRYERNKLQKEVEELRNLEISKVHKENLQLKKTLQQIKEEYQPIKTKIHYGHSKRSKRYDRK